MPDIVTEENQTKEQLEEVFVEEGSSKSDVSSGPSQKVEPTQNRTTQEEVELPTLSPKARKILNILLLITCSALFALSVTFYFVAFGTFLEYEEFSFGDLFDTNLGVLFDAVIVAAVFFLICILRYVLIKKTGKGIVALRIARMLLLLFSFILAMIAYPKLVSENTIFRYYTNWEEDFLLFMRVHFILYIVFVIFVLIFMAVNEFTKQKEE